MVGVGLTGALGTGKTAVLKMFAQLGAAVLSADDVVHQELKKNQGLKKKIKRVFGSEILQKGSINRQRLAEKVFAAREDLKKLNRLVHPLVRKRTSDFIRECRREGRVCVVEVPLLFEAGFEKLFDVTIGVTTDLKIQRERLRKKSRLTQKDISRRMRSQLSLKKKVMRCDFVIDNSGSRRQTLRQVKELMNFFEKS